MSDHTALSGTPIGSLDISGHGDDTALRPPRTLLVAAGAWAAAGVVTLFWPNIQEFARTSDLAVAQWIVALLLVVGYALHARLGKVGRWFGTNAARLAGLAVLLSIWQIASAKIGLWPQPYIPPPQGVIDAYVTDWKRLVDSVAASLVLLSTGIAAGAAAGFVTGLATGWTRKVGYWTNPVLRLIGPIPATSLIPIALFLFPTSFSASVFLVALATWFPVSVLTWSGVASVDSSYYDVARTLGARQRFLLLKIAIPGSLPHVFVGLFMGLGSAISVLVAAEMVGVKSGLGYYLDWAQGWAAYGHLFGGLLVMAVLFSSLTTLLFRFRDRLLIWQKGEVQW
ncbi:NitT/TauT family transport system permease protein [Pseudochelatococcus lubricantis]|uniref:NitT/TauT family transport system permease protein n=1 Tax=Pseudochelatococcus lubricantis TaxID=1538102 RepID=A0ABX0V3E0_9HYPH|nr:NitT/TauT family transport system permease protein [Pseudochelatococcus lubricantis]